MDRSGSSSQATDEGAASGRLSPVVPPSGADLGAQVLGEQVLGEHLAAAPPRRGQQGCHHPLVFVGIASERGAGKMTCTSRCPRALPETRQGFRLLGRKTLVCGARPDTRSERQPPRGIPVDVPNHPGTDGRLPIQHRSQLRAVSVQPARHGGARRRHPRA
jgi:hypothetical protein